MESRYVSKIKQAAIDANLKSKASLDELFAVETAQIEAEKVSDKEKEERRVVMDEFYAKNFSKQKQTFGTGSDLVDGVLAAIKRKQREKL